MLADPAFRERVCAAMDTVSHDVTVDPTETGVVVRIEMVQRTHGVPGFAKKLVGDETRIIQTERWTAGQGTDLEVEIPGKPGHIRGRVTLAANAAGAVESFDGEAKVNIPLVGGRLEGLIEGLFLDGMNTEQRVGTEWLAGAR